MALVLNLKTGLVNPQSKVVFDDVFTMVPYLSSTETPPNWNKLSKHSTEHALEEEQKVSNKCLHPQTNQEDQEIDIVPNPDEAISQQESNSPIDVNDINTDS